MNWYIDVIKKYAVFEGRASRQEYWMFVLINLVIVIALGGIDAAVGTYGIIGLVYGLAVLLPAIGVTIRRLHDTGRSGWWMLINMIPVIGFFIYLFFVIQDSKPEGDKFDVSPVAATAE